MFGDDTAAAAITEWAALRGEIDAAVLALVVGVSRHTPTVLFTNATTRLESDLTAAGLDGAFTAVVSSARTGFVKPDRRAYAAAEQALEPDRDPHRDGRIGYVDDDPANVAAARERGWDAWLFTGVADLRAWLAERGLVARTQDEHDRRGVVVALTPKGRKLIDAATDVRFADAAASLPPLAAVDRARLEKLLKAWLLAAG